VSFQATFRLKWLTEPQSSELISGIDAVHRAIRQRFPRSMWVETPEGHCPNWGYAWEDHEAAKRDCAIEPIEESKTPKHAVASFGFEHHF
jgi:hypothetical protein